MNLERLLLVGLVVTVVVSAFLLANSRFPSPTSEIASENDVSDKPSNSHRPIRPEKRSVPQSMVTESHLNSNEELWITADDDLREQITFGDLRFFPRRALPDRGYVPIESISPTIRVNVHNGTSNKITGIRISLLVTWKGAQPTEMGVMEYRGELMPGDTEECKFAHWLHTPEWGRPEIMPSHIHIEINEIRTQDGR